MNRRSAAVDMKRAAAAPVTASSDYDAKKGSRKNASSWFRTCMHTIPILLIGGIIVYTALLVYQFENAHQTNEATSLVILKLPRSGSSWFVETLNRIPDVYISKEIIQRGDLAAFSLSERSQHLARALRAPTDKLAYKHRWFPSSRFLEDYWMHRSWKWARPMRIVGVSVNPEYLKDFHWDALRRQHVHDPQFIVFLRSNLVKQALSAITGKELKRRCGSANLRESSACSTASLERPFHVAVTTLADELALWSQRYRYFMRFMWHELPAVQDKVASRAVDAARPPRPTVVYYEQLQSDLGNTISSAIASATGRYFSYEEQEQLERHLLTPSPSTWWAGGWRKRTSDDLSSVVENFDYLVQLLSDEKHESVCSLVREMLLETRYRVFAMDAGSLTAVFNCAQRLRGVQTRVGVRDFFEGGDEDEDALLQTVLATEDTAA